MEGDRVAGGAGEEQEHPFHRVHVEHPEGAQLLSLGLRSLLFRGRASLTSVAVVCVGTDRSTGDAFGPLVGSTLAQRPLPGVEVWGTLEEPVHATNLGDVVRELNGRPDTFVIAVDACLGRPESVGFVTVRDRPLQPGSGVNKQLPPVGHMHMVGVVNVGGFMEYFVLQSTRLSLVMRMAHMAAAALEQALRWEPGAVASGAAARVAPARE